MASSDTTVTPQAGLTRRTLTDAATPPIQFVLIVNSLHRGGAEKQLLWIVRTLAVAAIPCAVFELQSRANQSRHNRLLSQAREAGVLIFQAKEEEGYLNSVWRLASFLRANPQIIVWTWGARSEAAILLLGWLGLKRRWMSSLRSANRQAIQRQRTLLRLCQPSIARYVANSFSNCELLAEVCPGSISKCDVLNNALEELSDQPLGLPTARPMPLRVMMLGNIDRVIKGYDLALLLAQRIRAAGLPVQLHIAGRPDAGAWLQDEIDRLKLAGVVCYHGETTAPVEYLRSGHAFLLFSRIEGTPNALLEAMSLGLPAIATTVGDLRRLVADREQLRLIAIGDVDAAYAGLCDMLADWPGAVAMGLRGRAWCQTAFSPETCRERLLGIVAGMQEPK